MTLDRLAEALRQLGNFADAEFVLKLALEVKEELYGDKHSEVIGTLNNLVDALHAQEKLEEGVVVCRRLVDAYKSTFGETHPGVAMIASNLATVYHEKKHLAAEEFFNQAIAIKTKTLGYKHPEVAALNSRYASFLRENGRNDEAEKLQSASDGSVSGVWKAVAAKMTAQAGDKLVEPKLSTKKFDRKREPRI
jgi:tetratricopeptide (TPR) repeat protein